MKYLRYLNISVAKQALHIFFNIVLGSKSMHIFSLMKINGGKGSCPVQGSFKYELVFLVG